MIRSFADATSSDIYEGLNTKAAREIPQTVWKVARRKMVAIHAAKTLEDIAQVPGNRLEPMKYDMPGFFHIWVNDNYHVFFKFQNGDAYAVHIKNYHGRKTT